MTISFEGRVAIVTGAGGGLGRAYALDLARRGAKVVVNDLGGARDGSGASLSAAQAVVDEITAFGGEAMANGASVTDMAAVEKMVANVKERWGRVDILINNAGILRDKTLHKMAPEDFEAVVRVHLLGSAWCSRAALPVMQAQQYGRIVMTTSAAGLYGNFGQSNYGAAKLAVVGLMNTLKHEGGRFGVKVNTIAPVALTRMTEGLPLAQLIGEATPERVAAGVAWLASEACEVNGCILSAGAGYFSTVQIVEGLGVHAPADTITPEFVAANWSRIADASAARPFDSAVDALMGAFGPPKA